MKPPLVTAEDTTQWNMLMRVAQPLALLLLSDLGTVQSVAHSFARITMAMTNVSVANRHISDRMALYEMHSYQELNRLDPCSCSTVFSGAAKTCGRPLGC